MFLKKTFEGSSTELGNTEVVPTLNTPIENGQNAVWCASFLAAWKSMIDEVAKGDISLDDSPCAAKLLNKAGDPRSYVPSGSMYVAAGLAQRDIVGRIREGLEASFPAKPVPSFPGLADDALLAYSYLEANVGFSIPYFQNRKPLMFTDSGGKKSKISSFGIRSKDDYAYYKLRKQPRVLFRDGDTFDPDLEFAVDLCSDSSPSQIIVARIEREPTLAKALKRLEKGEKQLRKLLEDNPEYAEYQGRIGPNDTLLVPDLFWEISHRYSELEGKHFRNPDLKGQRLDIAQQDILFRLDRSGAELKSESKVVCLPVPTHFVLDRPFLICMRKRDSAMPYFAMWVDNADLLSPW